MPVERLWYGEDARASIARTLLAPFSWLFGAGVRLRNAMYAVGVIPSVSGPIPVASVGNLSVGGTGKTPLVAYLALRLQRAGAAPSIVMRGVGDDEARAYGRLAPGVPVIVDANRVRGVEHAAIGGADMALLDDAFQHRRMRRDVDIVLLSADRAAGSMLLLPAGPQREPLASLRRASLGVIVRKAVARSVARGLRQRVQREHPNLAVCEVALLADRLVAWDSGNTQAIDALREKRVLAISAIGDPRAFRAQLTPLARDVEALSFRDHHPFTAKDVRSIVTRAANFDMVVCTLKDAVKLGPQWPRQGPELWYVSQRLEVEWGDGEIDRMLARLLDLRPVHRQ